MVLAFILVGILITVFYVLNRNKPTFKTDYIFEDNISNLSDKEKTFWLLLSLYRDKAINVDRLACNVAYHHSLYMLEDGKISHDHIRDRVNLMRMQGAYPYGEIVGVSSNVDSLFDKFKNSENHNKTMLNMNYNCCGISVIGYGKVDYITVIFIKI